MAQGGKLLVSALTVYGLSTVLLYRPRQWPRLRRRTCSSTVYKGGEETSLGLSVAFVPADRGGLWVVCVLGLVVGGGFGLVGGVCVVGWWFGLLVVVFVLLAVSSPSLTRTPGVHSRIRREKTPRKKKGLSKFCQPNI